ncbi:hypothetical protein HDU92_000668 [Lobulomyces angularis]|nr:hypothetical protein HDU92_000668 [Lobulomyces angularis]
MKIFFLVSIYLILQIHSIPVKQQSNSWKRNYNSEKLKTLKSNIFLKSYVLDKDLFKKKIYNKEKFSQKVRFYQKKKNHQEKSNTELNEMLGNDNRSGTRQEFLQKRQEKLVIKSNNQELNPPFVIDVTCTASKYNYLTPPSDDQLKNVCIGLRDSIQRASSRLSNVVLFKESVYVSVNFASFCKSTNVPFESCKAGTLAAASPTSFHQFSSESAKLLGVDPNFNYPSALAKQYAPSDAMFTKNNNSQKENYDISMSMNADVKWNFGDPKYNIFEFGDTTSNFRKGQIYDLEQIFIHELLHGLGFISGWYPWIEGSLLPGWIDYEPETLIITGLSTSYIYDRFISDQVTGIWMNEYAKAIRFDADSVSKKLNTSDTQKWMSEFLNTNGGNLSRFLFEKVVQSPGSLVNWYFPEGKAMNLEVLNLQNIRDNDLPLDLFFNSPNMKPAVLYTPVKYEPGSSLSHLDTGAYDGSPDFVMRSTGTGGVGLDMYSPVSMKYGPIGEIILGLMRGMGWITSMGQV